LDVTETMLDTLFFHSVKVPRALRSLARHSLHPLVDGRRVTHGQMMGGYLSFPLLCLHSFIAARWASRGMDANILVNGDDCLLSTSKPIGAGSYPDGYQLNVKKTIFAETVAEINSTAFLKAGGVWREVRHLRRGGALGDFHGVNHMAKACASSPEWTDAFVRSRLGKSWGFLPSQLGLARTRVAYYRQVTLGAARVHTDLPCPEATVSNPNVLRCFGVPLADEVRAMTDFWFANGRDGGRKRDVFNPTRGEVRRSFHYRCIPRWKTFSYEVWRRSAKEKNVASFTVPCDFVNEEEQMGLYLLGRWRAALDR